MEFSNPQLAARLFALCAVDIDVENMQRLAEALNINIPAVQTIFTEAEQVAQKSTANSERLSMYRELADGVSDMVEGGRLSEADVPDDYQWLTQLLSGIAGVDPGNPVPRKVRA